MRAKRQDRDQRIPDASVERRRFNALLARLGLRAAFERMPKYVREQMFEQRCPEPVLRFDPAWPADASHARLRETLQAAFRSAKIEFDDPQSRGDLSVRDFFSLLPGVRGIVANTAQSSRLHKSTIDMTGTLLPKRQMPKEVDLFCELATPILEMALSLQQEAYLALHRAVVWPLVDRCRLDASLMYADLHAEPLPRCKVQVVMTIRRASPESRSVTLDGEARPVYRVGTNSEWHRIHWLTIDGGTIDKNLRGRELAVYAQSHALRQLHARLHAPALERLAEYWLYASLKEPNVIERQRGGDVLIEYRIAEHRLGYLVATPLDEMLILRTFLFLTMQPTPEARLLERTLKLTRRESDWLGLTELSAFTQTDLREDETLRPLLAKCGCGHLFELAEEDWVGASLLPTPKPLAEEVKKYLRMAA